MHTKGEEEGAALEVALYDNDWEWLDTQAQRAGMTLNAFVGRLLDDLYEAGRANTAPVDRPPKGNTALQQLVTDVTAVFGVEVAEAARARAYDTAAGTNGSEWVLAFQRAYVTELRRLLRVQ